MSALFPASTKDCCIGPGRRGGRSRWLLRAALFASAAGLTGCDSGDDMDLLVGVGQVWAYSTTKKSAVEANYRELSPYMPSCPAALSVGENCRYSRCRYTPEELPPPQSAGTIALTGGLEDIVLDPPEDNLYVVEREEPLFIGGEKLRFEIGGDGGIPPSSITLAAPTFVTVTDPPLTAEPNSEDPEAPVEPLEPLAIDRAKDLDVRWTPIPDSMVRVSLTLRQTFEDSDELQDLVFSCRFASWLGAGSLETENLEAIPVVSDPETAFLWVGTESTGRTFTGKWEHWFGVSAYESRPVTIE